MTLEIGDIVKLAGRNQNVHLVFAGLDRQRNRVPSEWGLFVPSDPGWGAQLTTLASARLVARPNWTAGMKCRWNGCDAVVMGITSTHLHLAWESSTTPVTISDATAANVNLFLTTQESCHDQEDAQAKI
jgi:hypothetical protein